MSVESVRYGPASAKYIDAARVEAAMDFALDRARAVRPAKSRRETVSARPHWPRLAALLINLLIWAALIALIAHLSSAGR
jgi:hypothetical protein